jgi:glycosyltransferase involved in cell wall biosynthesis
MYLKRYSLRFIDETITVAESNKKFMLSTFGWSSHLRVRAIPNGVDTHKYSNQKENDNCPSEKEDHEYTAVVVAGLNNQKGHEYLIKAIPMILTRLPRVQFLFVGDGHLRNFLETLTVSLGVQHAVRFLGWREDVTTILRSTDLFVLPSLFEGLPLSLIEAMACAKAVVATNVDGTADVVVDGVTGYLVPPKEPEQLAQKIVTLLKNRNLRQQFGRAGQERVSALFGAERMAENYASLYSKYLNSNNKS